MTDYFAIVLNGLFTGIGVILAHEFWEWLTKYRKKVKEGTKEILNGWKNVTDGREVR